MSLRHPLWVCLLVNCLTRRHFNLGFSVQDKLLPWHRGMVSKSFFSQAGSICCPSINPSNDDSFRTSRVSETQYDRILNFSLDIRRFAMPSRWYPMKKTLNSRTIPCTRILPLKYISLVSPVRKLLLMPLSNHLMAVHRVGHLEHGLGLQVLVRIRQPRTAR